MGYFGPKLTVAVPRPVFNPVKLAQSWTQLRQASRGGKKQKGRKRKKNFYARKAFQFQCSWTNSAQYPTPFI